MHRLLGPFPRPRGAGRFCPGRAGRFRLDGLPGRAKVVLAQCPPGRYRSCFARRGLFSGSQGSPGQRSGISRSAGGRCDGGFGRDAACGDFAGGGGECGPRFRRGARSAAGTAVGNGSPGGGRAGRMPDGIPRGGNAHGLDPPGVSAGHRRLAPEDAPRPAAAGGACCHRPRPAAGGQSDRHRRRPAAGRLPHPLSSYGRLGKDACGDRADAIGGRGHARAAGKRDRAAGVLLYGRR